jgi:predicted transposase/invertase (TIGR01784 family)
MATTKSINQTKGKAKSKPKSLLRFDWAIKRILRHKPDYKVLEGFLSVILNEDVRIISISESEANQEHSSDKFNRVDIFVENSKGELVIIEIQSSYVVDYYFRMLYGVSKAIAEHINKGESYDKVRKVYHINIVYFKRGKLGLGKDYVYHGTTEFRGIHLNDVLQLTAKQKKQFERDSIKEMYPEYYILCVDDFDGVAKDSLDEWIYYLKHNEIPDNFKAKGLAEARRRLQFDKLPENEKQAYLRFMDQMNYELGALEYSKAEGRAEGHAEGLKEGEAERDRLKKENESLRKQLEKLKGRSQ